MAIRTPSYVNYNATKSDASSLSLIESRIEDFSDSVKTSVNKAILNGQLIENISLSSSAASSISIRHSLGRKYKGFIVVAKNPSSVAVNEDNANTEQVSRILFLVPSSDVTISIWLF